MTTLPLSDVKARFSELAAEVERTHERLMVTRNGREAVVIMAVEDLEAIEATLELLRDPAAQRRVAQAEAEIARGEWLDEDQLRAMLRRP
jgi:prevent-host-death family protein